jgi:hypothetical protein
MGTRNHFTEIDIACPPEQDCSITASLIAVNNVSVVTFYGTAITTCVTGFVTDGISWTFYIGTETFGPIVQSTIGSLPTMTITQGAAAGSILAIDWTNFFSPVITQQNDLVASLVIYGTMKAEDDCGCTKAVSASAGMADDVLIPAPLLIVKFDGDVSAPNVAGVGTDSTTDVNGDVTFSGQVYDFATGAVPTGPTAGCSLVFSFVDSISGQIINRFTFDYSVAIDFTTDLPTASLDPVFVRTDGTSGIISWADFQPYFDVFSAVGLTGAIDIFFLKANFCEANRLTGCLPTTDEGNSTLLAVEAYTTCAAVSNSPKSTTNNPRAQVEARVVQPIPLTVDSQTGEILFCAAGGSSAVQDLMAVDIATGCVKKYPEVRAFTDASATGTLGYTGLLADTTRQSGGRDILYLSNQDSTGSNHSLLQLSWNTGTAEWDIVEMLVTVSLPPVIVLDTFRIYNGRPTLGGGWFGSYMFIYYTGVGDTYAMLEVTGAQMGTTNGAGAGSLDPFTGEIYLFAGSAAAGLQRMFRIKTTGDPTILANWSGTRLGMFDFSIDADGPLPTSAPAVGFVTSESMHTGFQFNAKTEILLTDRSNNKIKKITSITGGGGNGDWRIDTIAGDGVAATTDGNGLSAQFNVPRGIIEWPALSDVYYITERFGHVIRKYDRSTGDVTTVYTVDLVSANRGSLYF